MATAPRVPELLDRVAAYTWRLLLLVVAGAGILWVLGRLRFVVFALVLALLLARALIPVATALRDRLRFPPGLAAAAAVVGFLALIGGTVSLIAPAVADEFATLGGTLEDAVDDIETWVVEDLDVGIDRAEIRNTRDRLGEQLRGAVRSSGGRIAEIGVLIAEGLAGLFVGLILTFFILKDGQRFQRWTLSFVAPDRQPRVRTVAARSWGVLGGYLRGAALLGIVEGIILAVTAAIVGAKLAIPIGVITFMAAFVPFVGAIASGIIAVLVTLATAGVGGALVVAVVAIVVQQIDNEVLAPVVYGNALDMHPAAIILGVAAGGALFGLAGTFLAVPVAAVINVVVAELRTPHAVALD